MSFSVRDDDGGLEWAGTNLATLFAQPRERAAPAFWRMLADILRFNRETTAALAARHACWSITLGEYLDAERYGGRSATGTCVPMAAAIWSSPAREILDFPLPTFVRFCHNHGLLAIADRPRWRTVAGGGAQLRRRRSSRGCRTSASPRR